jgi:hypothetical protein
MLGRNPSQSPPSHVAPLQRLVHFAMQRHPSSELWLHDDAELAAVLGSPITTRTTIHEWQLSCVQRVTCASGETHIYKAQAFPSVEPTFYERARSPLLVKSRILPVASGPAALLLEDVQAPRLCDLQLPPERAVAFVDQMLARIAQITGDLPALADIRTPSLWDACAKQIVTNVWALADAGTPEYTAQFAQQVEQRSRSSELYETFDTEMGYVHEDLLGSNIVVLPDEYRVLDWQRPVWGPVALDRATLFESIGQDPRPHVLPGALLMRWVMRVGFFAAFALR